MPTLSTLKGSLRVVQGDIFDNIYGGNRFIPHIVNSEGCWGAGFVLSISKRWQSPEKEYRRWYRSQNNFKLGEIQHVLVQSDTTIINMIGQEGVGLDKEGNPPIRYDALEKCMNKVAQLVLDEGGVIHCGRFGSGLAGGSQEKIEKLIEKCWLNKGINVTIFEYTPPIENHFK